MAENFAQRSNGAARSVPVWMKSEEDSRNQHKSNSPLKPGWRPAGMAKPYSDDLRERVVRAVEGEVRATKRLANSTSA